MPCLKKGLRMKKKRYFPFIFIIFLYSSVIMAENKPASSHKTQIQPAGQIVWVSGNVKAAYPEQSPRVLARGSVLYEKDTLTTDTDSSGEIAFTDNSIVSLRPDTTFVIEQYHFDESKPSSGQYVMNLIKGGFRTITGFVAKAQPENYQVKTPVATIGVRGTTYQTNCGGGQCGVGLEHGAGVQVTNAGGSVVLNDSTPYATINNSNTKPTLSTIAPIILAHPPTVTPANAPPPANANQGAGGGNCGILIN